MERLVSMVLVALVLQVVGAGVGMAAMEGGEQSQRNAEVEYVYYNSMLQRTQRQKPEELRDIFWDSTHRMFHLDPETGESSSRLPDDLAWVTLSVDGLKKNLRNSLEKPLIDGELDVIDTIVNSHLQNDGLVWYNINTGDTSYTVPHHSAWERRIATPGTVFD